MSKSIFLMVILIVIFIKIFSSYMVSFFFFSLLEPDSHIRYCHHFTAPFVMAFAGKLLTFWSSPKQLGQMKPNLLIVATPYIFTRMIYSLWTCSGCENSWNTTYLMLGKNQLINNLMSCSKFAMLFCTVIREYFLQNGANWISGVN